MQTDRKGVQKNSVHWHERLTQASVIDGACYRNGFGTFACAARQEKESNKVCIGAGDRYNQASLLERAIETTLGPGSLICAAEKGVT